MKTEDENHQGKDKKPGIFYDSTIVHSNVPEAMKSENDNNEHFDVEGDVIKTELKVEIGNDSETVVWKKISSENQVLNVGKTAKSVVIKSEIEEDHNEKEENENGISVKETKGDLDQNEKHVSNVVQRKSVQKKESVQSGGKSFQCDICSKTFKKNADLERHHRTHTGKRPFVCNACKKSFPQLGHLKQHERIHSGEKPYECKTCNKTFSSSHDLKKHEMIHSGEKPFECKICKKNKWEASNSMKEFI